LLREERAQRKAGGQRGHRGAGRELLPEDQVDEVVDHYPDACRGCGHEFTASERRPGRCFGRHQVAELPPISVIVVEHRTQRLRCPQCKTKAIAQLPAGIGASAFGPRLHAAVVTLTARNRISRREMAELARELFGASLSAGAVDAICQRASDALADPHARLRDWLLGQGVLHVDETGWRTAGEGVRPSVCEAEVTGFVCQSGSRSPKWILRAVRAGVQERADLHFVSARSMAR
jgi:transposase